MQQPDAVARELGAPQPLRLRLGRAREPRLRLLDQRADDVRLPPGVEMRAQPLVRLARALGARPSASRSACGSPAASRSRSRRGRRRRSARACAGSASPSCAARAARRPASACRCSTPKRCCSSTTATARSAKSTLALDQRVRADRDLRRARLRARSRARFVAGAAGQQHDPHPELARRAPRRVRKCCSARVSVGAISAPCRPASTARSSA